MENNYPQIEHWEPQNQLLFDFGYSYALLASVTAVLKGIVECDDYPVEVGEILEKIEDFQEHRLKLRNTIYDNAEAALTLDRRLAALEKILAAADASIEPPSRLSAGLWDAIAEAQKLYERK